MPSTEPLFYTPRTAWDPPNVCPYQSLGNDHEKVRDGQETGEETRQYRLCLAALLTAPILAASPAAAEINADTIDKSIVWVDTAWSASVQVPFKDGTTETYRTTVYAYCTGWFVSDTGHVATAGHCVEADDGLRVSVYSNVIEEQGLTGVRAEDVDWPMSLGEPSIKIDQPSGIDGGVLSGKTAITAQLIAKQGFEKGDNALLRIADMKDTPALSDRPGSAQSPREGHLHWLS